jgi:hypothetical protein
MAEYVLTEEDVATLDFTRPFSEIMPQLHHYYVAWSEPRAFRYRKGLVWDGNCAWPRHVGAAARRRIIYKHYPCRSPQQLQVRWTTRKENRVRGFEGWTQDAEVSQQSIRNSKHYLYDDGIAPLKIDESMLPRHLERPHIRFVKKLFHGLGIWP